MTTWTTIYYKGVRDPEGNAETLEFQGPKIEANTEREAQILAARKGVILSDKYVKAPNVIMKFLYSLITVFNL